MHLTISNQTQDDLCCAFRGSAHGDHILIVQAHAKSVVFSPKCSLLVISRHSRNGETKENETIRTSSRSVFVSMPIRVNTGRRWNLVEVQPDSEWIVYRNKVRWCCGCSWAARVHAYDATSCLANTTVYLFFLDAIHPVSCLLSLMPFLYHP